MASIKGLWSGRMQRGGYSWWPLGDQVPGSSSKCLMLHSHLSWLLAEHMKELSAINEKSIYRASTFSTANAFPSHPMHPDNVIVMGLCAGSNCPLGQQTRKLTQSGTLWRPSQQDKMLVVIVSAILTFSQYVSYQVHITCLWADS